MGPKEKADLTRILLLNSYGGIWVDTDDVLLRDLRPLIEFAGEFATKLTMSFYFNNNILGIRAKSDLSKSLVDIVCTLCMICVKARGWERGEGG
jgi:mannosyltransferase OCH1-like enzyme